MLFALDSNSGASPYESLSNLCTILVIADGGDALPLHPASHTISSALQRGVGDGDVVVMASRALSHILDKFPQSLTQSEKNGVPKVLKDCFHGIFSLVTKPQPKLRHQKTTDKELKEELLNCLSLARNCADILSIAPSTEKQLKFCLSVLDDSKWTSCKVLRHCIGLMRSGELMDAGVHQQMEQLLHRHLSSLCHLDIDREWDELLCNVIEGMLTYRVWCAEHATRHQTRQTTRKRPRASQGRDVAASSGENRDVTRVAPLENTTEILLAIGERIFMSGTAESRLQLTLACLARVIETPSNPSDVNERSVRWILTLLQQSASRAAEFSNPFVRSRQRSAEGKDLWADTFKALPNLQWIVPPFLLSALVLLAKLCGADLGFRGDFMWAWRGDGGEYYPYSRSLRQRLTAMFFAAESTSKVLQTRHVIDLRTMTDTSLLTRVVSRIHFQPIPSILVFDGKLMIPSKSMHLSKEVSSLLQEGLRFLSFGHTQLASLARAIRLYIICSGPPNNQEDVIIAFRSLLTDQNRQVVEEISSALLQRDKGWAPILFQAGVADVLAAIPVSTASKELNNISPKRQNRPPVAELIRSAGSSPQLPPMQPLPIDDLPGFLSCATSAELLTFIESLEISTFSESQFSAMCAEIKEDDLLVSRLWSSAYTYVLRVLQESNTGQQEKKSLDERAFMSSHTISICGAQERKSAECPKSHPLRVHFSVNWWCDSCKKSNAFGSLACRECNYDLCSDCSNAKLSRMDVNMTAVVADVIRGWRECQAKDQLNKDALPKDISHAVLFTSRGILPTNSPVFTFKNEDVHFSAVDGCCRCNIAAPFFLAKSVDQSNSSSCFLRFFFNTFLGSQQQGIDTAIEPAIVDALESHGEEIFEKGVAGIPVRVKHVIEAIAPFISLPFKRDMAHFLSVGCRRFGLFHLQDVNAELRGTVVGDVESNGLATKVTVRRDTNDITRTLFDTFFRGHGLRNKVEFNFEGEEGTGEGPTQELYAELCRRYQTTSMLWHVTDDGARFAFPTLLQVYREEFFVLGACCGRAFADGYVMDTDLLPMAWRFIRSSSPSAQERWSLFTQLEPEMSNSYNCILQATDAELENMGIEQDEDGTPLTREMAGVYVEQRVEQHLANATENLRWFSLGISSTIDMDAFWFLKDEEMSIILCGAAREDSDERLFDEKTLRASVVEAHGYSAASREVAMLTSVLGKEFTREQQKLFIEFLTGCPRLPLNGLAGLGRKITVVRKELDGEEEQTLPSCNTCFLYLKLPPYSSSTIMKARLLTAITEGRSNFSLS